MKQLTATGRTVEEAVKSGLAQLGLTEENAKIEVLDEGKKGFLGLFKSKPAVVKIEETFNPVEQSVKFIKDVAAEMGINVEVKVNQSGRTYELEIDSDSIGYLIGRRGQTLNALQVLTQLVANRYSDHYITVLLNPEGYREKRKEALANLAVKLAKQVTQTRKRVKLEPMPSYERKVIHNTLTRYAGITTSSVGKEPNRSIVIEPADKKKT